MKAHLIPLVLLLLAMATATWWRAEDIPRERVIGRVGSVIMVLAAAVLLIYG